MKFRLEQSIPPGIPTWFIAREHRFSIEIHWRLGVLLADTPRNPKHLGLVQSYPQQRYMELKVRGPMPHYFFVVLRDGLEFTLARFPGLKVKRTLPCPGHKEVKCDYEFDLCHLEMALEKGKTVIQCPEAFEDILVPQLLFGLHAHTEDAVIKRINYLEKELSRAHKQIGKIARSLTDKSGPNIRDNLAMLSSIGIELSEMEEKVLSILLSEGEMPFSYISVKALIPPGGLEPVIRKLEQAGLIRERGSVGRAGRVYGLGESMMTKKRWTE
jgi:hypothetical protein